MKTRLLMIIVAILVPVIAISFVSWIEYGMVCSNAVVRHLQKYSNLFDENTTSQTYAINDIGYPFGVNSWNLKECVEYVLEKRTLEFEN